MTEAEADKIIENARPVLRTALCSMMQGQGAQFVTIAQQPMPNGHKWPIKVGFLNAPFAALVEGLLSAGVPAMMRTYEQLSAAPAAGGATPQKTPAVTPGSKRFTVPGA